MKKTTIIVMFITVLSKILGFARESVLSALFYGSVSDAFGTAVAIPNTIVNVIAAAFVTGIIPMLSRMKDEEKINSFTTNVVNLMFLAAGFVALFLFLFPSLAVFLLGGSGFEGEQLALTISFVRMISFSVLSIIFIQIGTGYLNVKGSFIGPAAIAIPMNILVIIGMFLASTLHNYDLLIIFQLVGIIIQGIFIFYLMKKRGFKYKAFIDFKDEDLRIMLGLSLPVVISSLVGQVNDVMMRNTASSIGDEGSVTKLNNIFKVVGFVQGVFVTAIMTVAYPNLTREVVSKDKRKITRRFNETILMLAITVVPAFVGFLSLPNEILSFTFGYGKVTPEIISQMVPMFIGYSLVLIPMALRDLAIRMHYAYEDMIQPVKNTVIVTVIFIPLMLVSTNYLRGNENLALAAITTSFPIALIVGTILIFKSLYKHAPFLTVKPIRKDIIKIVMAALLMAVVILVLRPVLGSLSPKISLLIEVGCGVVVYFVMLIVLGNQFFLSLIQSFLVKRKKTS